ALARPATTWRRLRAPGLLPKRCPRVIVVSVRSTCGQQSTPSPAWPSTCWCRDGPAACDQVACMPMLRACLIERWLLDRAAVERERAAGAEPAARRRGRGGGRVAHHLDSLFPGSLADR